MAEPRFFLLSIPDQYILFCCCHINHPCHLATNSVQSIRCAGSHSTFASSDTAIRLFPRSPTGKRELSPSIPVHTVSRVCSWTFFYSSLLRNANDQPSLSATVLFLSPSVPTFVPCTPIGSRPNLLLVTKSGQVDVILSAEFPPIASSYGKLHRSRISRTNKSRASHNKACFH